jgi:hydrogenase maturation protease
VSERGVLVVGVGNELRGDDGAGIAVARRVRGPAARAGVDVREQLGEPIELLDVWQGRDAVVLVDTMRSGAPAGTVRRLDASRAPLPAGVLGSSSTHAFALGDAIELGRVLRRLPPRVIVYAVEGRTFEAGACLSDELEAVAGVLCNAVLREARELAAGGKPE